MCSILFCYAGCLDVLPAVSGVNLSKSADKTHAPASFVVHTDVGWPVDGMGSVVLMLVSATQSAWLRTRTSNVVSMR